MKLFLFIFSEDSEISPSLIKAHGELEAEAIFLDRYNDSQPESLRYDTWKCFIEDNSVEIFEFNIESLLETPRRYFTLYDGDDGEHVTMYSHDFHIDNV